MTAFSGAKAIGAYRIEDTFNTAPSDAYQTFGRNVTVDTFEGTNNGTELYEFCQRTPTSVVESNFEGSWSVSFVLSRLDFLKIYDSTDEDADFDSDTNPDYTFDDPQSFEMVVHRKESTVGTEGITRVATGCVPTSLEIDAQVDGTVQVTMDGIYADEEIRDSEDIEGNYSQVSADKDALNFADVTAEFAGLGTTTETELELPQGVTISLDNTMNLLSVLGQRPADQFTTGPLTGTVDFTEAVEVDDTRTLESMYGSTDAVGSSVDDDNGIAITMDNGNASGSGQVKVEWTLTGFTESYSESGIDVEEDFVSADVTQTLNGTIRAEVVED